MAHSTILEYLLASFAPANSDEGESGPAANGNEGERSDDRDTVTDTG
jgi:hypothetical protein